MPEASPSPRLRRLQGVARTEPAGLHAPTRPNGAALAAVVAAGLAVGAAWPSWAWAQAGRLPDGVSVGLTSFGWPDAPGADLALALLVVALAAWTLGLVAQRLGVPAALGELLGGIGLAALVPTLLRPSVLAASGVAPGTDGLAGGIAGLGIPGLDIPGLGALAAIGIGAAMFTAGLDGGRRVPSERRLAASVAALAGPLVAVLALLALARRLPPIDAFGLGGGLVVAFALSAGIVGVRSRATKLPHLAALSSLPLAAGVLAFGPPHVGGRVVGLFALALAAWLVRVALVAARARLRGLGRTTLFVVALVVAAAHALLAVAWGLPSALGAGVAGYTMGRVLRGTPLADALTDLTRTAVTGAATPLLFAAAGLAVAHAAAPLAHGVVLGLAAVAGRAGAMALAAPLDGHTRRRGLTAGLALAPRGVVAVYLPLAALADGVLTPGLYAAAIVAIATTLALDPLARRLGARLEGVAAGPASGAERAGVIVIGAGPLARRLASLVSGPVVLVDRNERNCAQAEAEGLAVVAASALDAEVLREAGASRACYLVALTGNPQLNRAVADIARTTFGIPNVFEPDLSGRAAALETPDTLFGDSVTLGDWEYHADRRQVRVEERPLVEGRTPVPTAERLPIALRRGALVVPYARAVGIQEGDAVVSLVRADAAADPARGRFEALVRTAPVLELDGPTPMVMFFDRIGSVLAPRLGLDAERLSVLLMQREADAGTVVLPGLAIPHISIPGEGVFEMVIARARTGGIVFPDREPVRAAFVLVSTSDERSFHLRALAGIAHAANRDDFDDRWANARTADDLRALLLDTER